MKVIRKNGKPWMTKEPKELIRQRNRYRRSMHTDRKKWQEVSKLIAELTIENKRILWRGNLEKMAESNDASEAWKVVKTLNGEAPTQSGKTLIYQGREYCNDKAKASAFCQEYAKISGRKSDKASRRLTREVRREMQWHR